jgi:gliding motility-associated-like protein
VAINEDGVSVDYTPAVDFNGTEVVTYTVSDGTLTDETGTLTVTVTPVNDAPTITSTAVTEATEDVAYTYEITTEDIDGDLVTVSATGLPSWLTLTDNTLSGTPTEGETGSEITITATDDGEGALTATQTFTIVVTPVNDAPTITSTAVTEATEDVAYTYEITTEDIDGDLVTVSATGLPSWLTLTDNTLSGTPTEGEIGSEITITATDDGEGALTATQTFTIVVTPVNDAPTITSTAVTEATEDVAYTYEITTEDIDGDLVTVSATGLPSWLTLTDNTLSGTPTEGETGSEITITATDDGEGALTATQTFTIVITPVNDAPTITSTAVTEATEDVAYTYEITTEDIDGDLVTVSATGLPSWLTLTDNTLSGTPTEGEIGSEITITATDDGEGALTATQIFTIVVTPVNDAPVAVADIATVSEDAATTSIDVIANDTDEEEDTLTLTLVNTSGIGTVAINPDGISVDYTPSADFNGTEVITYTVSDGTDTATGTLTVTVTPVNDAPTITSTAVTEATEDVAYTYEITTEDIDGDLVTVSATGLPSWLTLTDNTLSGTPTEGEIGSEITITATDDGEGALTATQIFTIVVTPVNDAPVAVADTATVLEDAATTSIDVLANDTSEEEDTLTLTLVNTSGTGTVSINLDGFSVDYTPSVDFNGTEVITYTVSDGTDTATGTLTVTVRPVNDAPVAVADTATVSEDSVTTSIDVIANDTDVDLGNILSLTTVSTPGTGTVSINSDGFSVDYIPSANFNGTEVITYTVSDGTDTATGTLTVTVTSVNDAPEAIADTATVSEDSATTSIDVIANDTDEEEDTLTLTLVNTSGTGTVSINLDGVSVDYTPSADFNGTEVITYTVSDGTDTATGTLTVTVTSVNDAPIAVEDTATVLEDAATTSIDVIANDTDVDLGNILSLTTVSTPGTGTVSINSDGVSVDYTPSADFNGTEVITYTVSDGTDTATGALTVTVTSVNDAPEAIADTATVSEDAATTSIDVIANDTDEEEDTLTLTLVNTSGTGTVSINLDGVSVDYTPSADFNGTEVITYTVSDGTDTATGTLTVTVTSVNDAPVAVADTATVLEDAATTSIDVIANDTDVDLGNILSLTTVSTPGTGTVSINSDGFSVDYIPSANFNGTEVITYTVSDGTDTATGTLTVTVTSVNDAPEAIADTATVSEDSATTSIDVIANDTDEEEDTLTLTLVNTSGTGTVSINLDGVSVDYTPSADFNGTEVITYTVSDGTDTATGTLTVTVTPVNDAPIAVEDTASVLENAIMISTDVISNDIDVDGDILLLSAISYSGLGTVIVNVDEITIDYTPAPNFIGTEVINYSVTDGVLSSEGVLNINVITPEEIQITKPELNIPKFFTPNGDGINDTWNIKWNNISNYKIIEVNIYNRYGKILKKINSFDNGWDGTYNGKLMPPNDYWVAIKLVPMNETKRIIIETSNFSLIR